MKQKPELPVEIEKALRCYWKSRPRSSGSKKRRPGCAICSAEHMVGLERKCWYPKMTATP